MARKTPGDATPKIIREIEKVLTWSCASMSEPFLYGDVVISPPLSMHWNVSIKAAFSQVAEPFTQTAGCAFKALTKPVYPSMMKAQLNNNLIVLVTGTN